MRKEDLGQDAFDAKLVERLGDERDALREHFSAPEFDLASKLQARLSRKAAPQVRVSYRRPRQPVRVGAWMTVIAVAVVMTLAMIPTLESGRRKSLVTLESNGPAVDVEALFPPHSATNTTLGHSDLATDVAATELVDSAITSVASLQYDHRSVQNFFQRFDQARAESEAIVRPDPSDAVEATALTQLAANLLGRNTSF